MKKNTLILGVIASFVITFFVTNQTNSQSVACDNCVNTLTACVASQGSSLLAVAPAVMTADDGSGCNRGTYFVSGAAANGCVTAYNNGVVNHNCTCYPFAVLQVTSPRGGTMRRTVVTRR